MGVDSPVHRRQRYQGKSRGRFRSQLTGWTGTGPTGTRSDSPSPRRRGSRSTSSAPWCRPAPRRAGGGMGSPGALPRNPVIQACPAGPAGRPRCTVPPVLGAGKILPLRRRTRGGRDTPAHPPDKPSPVTGPATLRPGFASARPAGTSCRTSSRLADTVVSSGRRPGRSDEVGVKRQGCRTRLLAQPQAPGIPGAGPGQWPARPP